MSIVSVHDIPTNKATERHPPFNAREIAANPRFQKPRVAVLLKVPRPLSPPGLTWRCRDISVGRQNGPQDTAFRSRTISFAPPNPVVIGSLLICALSVGGAVFLIVDLDQRFSGLIQISSASLRDALSQLGQ
jgi:hypothetical protein